MKSPILLRTVLCMTAAACSASSAHAQVIFLAAGGAPRTDGGKVVGVTLNSFGQTISSLGFYDHNSDGLAGSYQVGLWDASQNLVASTTVTPASPLFNGFRYEPITPITIGSFATPQAFTIGALLPPTMPDVWLDNALLVLSVGFTGAGTGQFTPSGSLVYPATFDNSPYLVVNANGPTVPEPASLALAAVATIGGVWVRRLRKAS